MNTAFRASFEADLSALRDAALLRRIKKVIEQVEAAGFSRTICLGDF